VLASTVFQRNLPNAGIGGDQWVNNGAGPNRSNVDWADGPDSVSGYDIVGDNFSFGYPATVNTITVYEVANTPCPTSACNTGLTNTAPGAEFSNISLYVGPDQGTLTLQTSVYVASQVFYYPSVSYQGTSGTDYYPIYALTFTLPTPLYLAAGVSEAFAVDGVVSSSELALDPNAALNLAAVNSTDALDSSTVGNPVVENGADNAFEYYNLSSQSASTAGFYSLAPYQGQSPFPGSGSNPDPTPGLCDSAPGTLNYCSGAWDKGSDLAVLIGGTLTPEPGTLFLSILGILAFASRMRRRV